MQNPILDDVQKILLTQPENLNEHSLHRKLKNHPYFLKLGKSGKLHLFQKHFLVMNALYQIQQEWQTDGKYLEILPLSIRIVLKENPTNQRTNILSTESSLAAWYLDWNNYLNATDATVHDLLDQFWKMFTKSDQREAALKDLNLDVNVNQDQIENRYKEMVQEHHPDKGGDPEQFILIQNAWENLRF